MILKNLKLENFGSIEKANLNFQSGFNIISGNIGQGKSHVIYSIAYLLLNVLKDKRVDNYIKWGESGFAAQLTLEHLSKNFLIRGIHEDGSNSRYLKVDNQEYDDITSTLNVLKSYFDPARCRAAMISFQGDTDIVSSTPAIRRDAFRKIYDLEFVSQIKALNEEIEALETGPLKKIDIAIGVLTNKTYNYSEKFKLPYSTETIAISKERVNFIAAQTALILQKIKEYEAQVLAKANLTSKLRDLQVEIDSITLRKTTLEREIDGQDKKMELLEAEEFSEVDFLKRKLGHEDFEEHLRELQAEYQAIANIRIPAVDESDIRAKLSNIKDQITKCNIDSNYLKAKMRLVESGKCPTCERDFDNNPDEILKLQNQIDELKNECEAHESETRTLEELLSKYNKAVSDQGEIDKNREQLDTKIQAEILSVASTISKLEAELKSKTELFKQKKLTVQQLAESNKTLLTEYESQLLSKSKEMVALNIENNELIIGDKPEESSDLDEEKTTLESQIANQQSLIDKNVLIEEQNEALKKEEAEDKTKLKEFKLERDNITSEITLWKQGVVILKKDFPNYVIHNSISSIENNTNLFLDKTYEGRYHIKIVEDKAGIGIKYGSNDKDIRISSGGEQDLFNLGLKHGFCRLTDLGVLILDEVDKFMSLTQSKHTFSIINEMLIDPKNEINQVLVITHKDEVKELLATDFDAKVFKAENNLVTEE